MTKKLNQKVITLLMAVIFIAVTTVQPFAYAEDMIDVNTNAKPQVDYVVKNPAKRQLEQQPDIYIEDNFVETMDSVGTAMLKEQAEAKEAEILEQEERRRTTVESSRNISYYEIGVYTDLSVMNTITADQMNEIIDYWGAYEFMGHGQTFIDASKQSGLDPVYILAHAAIESGWGTSEIAQTKHNYFGIGAFDYDPYNCSYTMGDGLAQGIIEGAIWIADNYYNEGQTSLYTMRYNGGYHEYCTSTTWADNIANIMYTSYSVIQ